MSYKLLIRDPMINEIVSGHIRYMQNGDDFVKFLLFVLDHANDWEGIDYSKIKKIIDDKQEEYKRIWE